MRIAHITPGSGGSFYCENCLRDIALVKALRAEGHDAFTVPMYLPVTIDDPGFDSAGDVFFGGINAYLQQVSPVFRHTPRWLDRLFDSPALLRWVAKRASMTRARGLCEMTLSMLRGADGRQAKELVRLVDWLASGERPDVVCLSNLLLAGLAEPIRRKTGARVVALLQDEDTWIDAMPPPYRDQVWNLLAEKARGLDGLIAVSRFYADAMAGRLGVDRSRVAVVRVGLPLEGYEPAVQSPPLTLGYLARMSEELGLGILADAYLLLRQRPGLAALRLKVAGGYTADDVAFLAALRRRLAAAGAPAEFLPNLGRPERQAFLRGLSVLSVPTSAGGAFGLFLIEAMACGVPVVQPRAGAFTELVEMTRGGTLYTPNDAPTLAAGLESLLRDPALAAEHGRQGRRAVREHFTSSRMAQEILRVI